jgi:hypothetical protein
VAGRHRRDRLPLSAANLLGDRNPASTTFFAVANAGGTHRCRKAHPAILPRTI